MIKNSEMEFQSVTCSLPFVHIQTMQLDFVCEEGFQLRGNLYCTILITVLRRFLLSNLTPRGTALSLSKVQEPVAQSRISANHGLKFDELFQYFYKFVHFETSET